MRVIGSTPTNGGIANLHNIHLEPLEPTMIYAYEYFSKYGRMSLHIAY